MSPFDLNVLKDFKDEYPISYLAVFGSYARGEQTVESDLDLLVEFKEPIGFFDLVRIQREMSEKVNLPVDLVTQGAMSPRIRPYINADLQVIFDEK